MATIIPSALQTRTVNARVMLAIFNEVAMRRLMSISSIEQVSEFNILNNTLLVKILDSQKLANLNKQRLKGKVDVKASAKWALGRTASIQIAKIINIINYSPDLKARLTLTKEYTVINLLMHGKTVVVNAVNTLAQQARQKQLGQVP